MTFEIVLIFSILVIVMLLFAFEVFSIDKIALLIIVVLLWCNLVTPEEAISGFSNTATITILSIMIIAVAMEQNGVISWLANGLKKLNALHIAFLIPIYMLISGTISAFISTTAVVIVFIKLMTELSNRFQIPQGKLLLPISFAGILGGSCTLMGTSTNLVVNSMAKQLGAERFSFFEFSMYGVIFLAIGIVIVTIASIWWLPSGKDNNLSAQYHLDEYLTTITITNESDFIGKRIEETVFHENQSIQLLKLIRDDIETKKPGKYITLKANDVLLVACKMEEIAVLNQQKGFLINSHDQKETDHQETENNKPKNTFIELLMLPGASLLHKRLQDLQDYMIHGALPLAIKKRRRITNENERLMHVSIDKVALKVGDRLLVEIPEHRIAEFTADENIAVLQSYDFPTHINATKKYISFTVLLLVIATAASGLCTVLTASLSGCAILLLCNCITLNNVYHKINWEIIFLLSGMFPLGIAMHNSGADVWLSEILIHLLHHQEPIFSIAVIFGVTMIISGLISNNATAVVMTPIAIAVATGMHLPLKPFILAVLFAANFSFFTPMGYQTNTLIYGMGIYKFKHFIWIGGILSVILWGIATLLLSTML
ncbi:SLC13 family permease [Zhouia sp. PK063]|uniref:SLC13 family permease n=1 Tax=Zhouia sp. PK063 TaxID=3373602 RepID=UPI0037B36DDF